MEETEQKVKDMKNMFDANINEIYKRGKHTTKLITKETYDQMVAKIKANRDYKDAPEPYKELHSPYDVINLNGVDKLIVYNTQDNPQFYVHMEEMFQVIYDTHVAHHHCGRIPLVKEINTKYKNITRQMVRDFLRLCFMCNKRIPGVVTKTPETFKDQKTISDKKFTSCQVNVIDMEDNQDGPFRYILIYEDHQTKFVQLRPLKNCSTKEIAESLLEIFTTFGAPDILHSENGRELAHDIVKELANQWNQIKMVHGKSDASSLNRDVRNLIDTWKEKNGMVNWEKGLYYVQLLKNKCHHKAIDRTPYEAMFGSKCKIGLDCEDLPSNSFSEIETEEDLKVMVNENRASKVKLETSDNNCDEESVDYMENYLKSLKQENESEEEDENRPHSKIIVKD